jgi:cytochrome P450
LDIARDTHATVLIGLANRDPKVFAEPNTFDVTLERDKAPLTFGLGRHFCLGAALARLEGRLFFNAILERFPDLRLAGEPRHGTSLRLRGWDDIKIILGEPAKR